MIDLTRIRASLCLTSQSADRNRLPGTKVVEGVFGWMVGKSDGLLVYESLVVVNFGDVFHDS